MNSQQRRLARRAAARAAASGERMENDEETSLTATNSTSKRGTKAILTHKETNEAAIDVSAMNSQQRRLARRAAARAAAAASGEGTEAVKDTEEGSTSITTSKSSSTEETDSIKKQKEINGRTTEALATESTSHDSEDGTYIKCRDCGKDFLFLNGEAEFFALKGWPSPSRCKICQREKKRRLEQVGEDRDPAKKDKVSVPLGKSSNFDEAPKKRRKGKRSKQKNIKKDNRPQHLKPTYLTPGAPDFVQAKPAWAPKERPALKTRQRLQQQQQQRQLQQQQ